MSTTSDAHILVTIPNATLTSSSSETFTGPLALEYVTFDIPSSASATATRDVLLVLRIGTGDGAFEAPLDPARTLTVSTLPPSGTAAAHRYVFHATRDDSEFSVEFPATPETADDVELFHSVLVGYAADVHGGTEAAAAGARADEVGDLRGRFVLMNEDNGEIVGALDRSVRVREDPSLGESVHEDDPVVVELPEGGDALDELRDVEVIVRAIPPEDRDWMVKGAVFVSHAISGTTTLLTSAMTTASNMYIARSTPASSASTNTLAAAASSSSSSSSPNTTQPSRTLLLLQSPTTRKHLTSIHTVSGGAVKLSNKAVATVDRLIQRVVADRTNGNGNGRGNNTPPATLAIPTPPSTASGTGKPPLPPRSRSPSPAAYLRPSDNNNKPPLPPRDGHSRSRTPSPSPPQPSQPQPQPPRPLGTSARVALSATIILASLAASTVRLAEAGGAAVTAAVAHKYGTTAGENAALAAGTMRNVVLVYVDVRGLGRRAIVKNVARTWAKGRAASAMAGASPKK